MPDPMIFVDDEKVVLEMPAIPEMDVRKLAKRVAERVEAFDRQFQRTKYELAFLAEGLADDEGARSISGTARHWLDEAKQRAMAAQEFLRQQRFTRALEEMRLCEESLRRLYECRAEAPTT